MLQVLAASVGGLVVGGGRLGSYFTGCSRRGMLPWQPSLCRADGPSKQPQMPLPMSLLVGDVPRVLVLAVMLLLWQDNLEQAQAVAFSESVGVLLEV